MNEKFNKNAKVEQLTEVVLSNGEEKGLIVKDPLDLASILNDNKFAVDFRKILSFWWL